MRYRSELWCQEQINTCIYVQISLNSLNIIKAAAMINEL